MSNKGEIDLKLHGRICGASFHKLSYSPPSRLLAFLSAPTFVGFVKVRSGETREGFEIQILATKSANLPLIYFNQGGRFAQRTISVRFIIILLSHL